MKYGKKLIKFLGFIDKEVKIEFENKKLKSFNETYCLFEY